MKKKTSLKNDKEAAEALVSKTANESDVDEEQQIADLSAVPTPKIGFKMPKLGAEEGGKKEGKDEGKKRPLTANLLNNQVIFRDRAAFRNVENSHVSRVKAKEFLARW